MSSHDENGIPFTTPRQSATFTADINSDIRRAAATGIYDIRGGGAAGLPDLRSRRRA